MPQTSTLVIMQIYWLLAPAYLSPLSIRCIFTPYMQVVILMADLTEHLAYSLINAINMQVPCQYCVIIAEKSTDKVTPSISYIQGS
jgi:hypothetical protein